MKRTLTLLVSLLVAALATLATAPAASGANPGPNVNIDKVLHLLPGTLSNTSASATMHVFAKWNQYDPDGIVSEHGTISHWVVGQGDVIDASFNGIRTSLTFTAAVDELYEIKVVATDGKGKSSTTQQNVWPAANLTQEGAATYSPGWTSGVCACWSGGSAMKSSKAGQKATLRFEGNQVALVTDRGPGRGTADLLLDGVKVGTLDAAAATTTNLLIVPTPHKTVLWQQHTLEVKVTSGRIDIDGFLYTDW